jgi:uncharacterized protein (DUF302 family)
MSYYFNKVVSGEFDGVVSKVIAALKQQNFGILTDIDVKETLKQKIAVEFRSYRILGACNPPLAHRALLSEDKIGTMLPCNVIVQDLGRGRIEVAAINPLMAMEGVANAALTEVAKEVAAKLKACVDSI